MDGGLVGWLVGWLVDWLGGCAKRQRQQVQVRLPNSQASSNDSKGSGGGAIKAVVGDEEEKMQKVMEAMGDAMAASLARHGLIGAKDDKKRKKKKRTSSFFQLDSDDESESSDDDEVPLTDGRPASAPGTPPPIGEGAV